MNNQPSMSHGAKLCTGLCAQPQMFSSAEATLKDQVAIGQGWAAYKAVPVSAVNNHDLKELSA